jgi:hypothetical protein
MSRTLAALAATLTLALLAAPVSARDKDDLEDPNSCSGVYGSDDVPSGTVVVLPPGTGPTIFNPGPVVVVNGEPQSNVYMCVGGHWIWAGTARKAGPRDLVDAGSVTIATIFKVRIGD